jgi:lipid A 3-O-deacylase
MKSIKKAKQALALVHLGRCAYAPSFAALLIALSPPLAAQTSGSVSADDLDVTSARNNSDSQGGVFTAVVENDVFGELKQDRNYTNGLKLAWMTPAGAEPRWARALGDALTPERPGSDVRLEFEIGQTMYTPSDLRRSLPDPNDRPYAGLLYGSLGLIQRDADRSLDQYQLVLGVVGPSSGAGDVQRWFHERIDAVEPRGWNTQIRNRVVAELRYQRTERVRLYEDADRYGIEFSPHYGASLGNLTTSANAGVGIRLGRDLPEDFGPPRIAPSLPGSGYFEPNGRHGWYVFAGLDVRYVAYSLVLDEHSALGFGVERRPWVADAEGGLAFYGQRMRVAYTQVWRTREYETQRDRFSSFGALSVTWRY